MNYYTHIIILPTTFKQELLLMDPVYFVIEPFYLQAIPRNKSVFLVITYIRKYIINCFDQLLKVSFHMYLSQRGSHRQNLLKSQNESMVFHVMKKNLTCLDQHLHYLQQVVVISRICILTPLPPVCYLIKSKHQISNTCENLRINVTLQTFAFLFGLYCKLSKPYSSELYL